MKVLRRCLWSPDPQMKKGRALLPYQAVAVGFVWIASGEKL
jgi:hypothetical protein